MYTPARFAAPRYLRRSPETGSADHDRAGRNRLLETLACSIGRLMARLMAEMDRVDDGAGPASDEAQARPVFRSGLRRIGGVPGSPHAHGTSLHGTGLRGTSPDHIARAQGELRARRRDNPGPVVFWEALDPIERDAFRSVAFPRTFAAGARLMEEGDHAAHVIVILSGRTTICVEENGRERILAERGPGQLVGERAALHISVRSASVIALETVQALVVRTGDFAAFISAHPSVLGIVESQLYDRLTEDRTGHQLHVLNGQNCTVILSDVVGFGARTRTDEDRRIIREALLGMTHTALRDIPDAWSWEDRGDGLLTVVPPSVPTADVIADLHAELPPALEEHNRLHPDPARIQLRVAINVGPVTTDTVGVSGEAIIVTARLVDAPLFKEAIKESGAGLGVIVSTFIYETVIRHAPDLTGYSRLQVDVKESNVPAWMKLFDTPLTARAAALSGRECP